jgi:hypothetical protein
MGVVEAEARGAYKRDIGRIKECGEDLRDVIRAAASNKDEMGSATIAA